MVVIRLSRRGRKNRPFYFICVADKKSPRDGKFIEKVGHYDPLAITDRSVIDKQKIAEWVSKGAQMSDRVKWLVESSDDNGHLPAKVSKPKTNKAKKQKEAAEKAAAASSEEETA